MPALNQPLISIPGYQLLRQIGSGGMATVYLAVQTSLDRKVAIKVMRRSDGDDSFEKRFLFEGRTMAKLPHRNIVGVYDIVQTAEINYIAMEYLEGGTLSDKLREGLSLAEAIAIVVQVAGALQFAHDNGVVHRDLKPANIMFRDAHTPVLTDFGIARQRDSEATRLTQTGMMIGTPTYMSPEQATGDEVDGRSDQYSLGVMFYEMLTGSAPFQGETPLNVVLAHLHQPPPPLPPQFAHFQPVMDRLLAKKADQRYSDLKVFVGELKAMLTQSETLLARLQIDPSQSASEQLRALGFSESQINTGSGSSASALSNAVARSRQAGHRATGPGVRMDDFRRRRPPWLVPAAAGVLLVVLGVVAVLIGTRDSLDPAVRALVDDALRNADRLVAEGRLVAPPGDNAYEKLQTALQVAPGLDEAEQRLAQIATQLREAAAAALEKRQFEVAEQRVQEALAVAPGDAEATALRSRIDSVRRAAETAAKVERLLVRAEDARKAGRLTGDAPDTALALVRQALAIDPASAPAKQRYATLVGEILAPARAELESGRLEQADGKLRALAGELAGDEAWQQLLAEIDSAREAERERQRVAALLAEARQQVRADRLAQPAGDNALETLARLREIDAGNSDARALSKQIGDSLAQRAARAERDGRLGDALALYEQALQAQPDDVGHAKARAALQQRLGERESRLAAALSGAREAIAQRRFLAPAGSSAADQIEQALAVDPENGEARRLQAQLPGLIRESANALADEGRIADAVALLETAAKRYPEDRALAQRVTELAGAQRRAAAAAEREQLLAEVRSGLGERQPSPATAAQVATALAKLLANDPNDRDAQVYRDTFLGNLLRAVYGADSLADVDALERVVAPVRQALAKDPSVDAVVKDLEARRGQLQAAERERVAAQSGVLVLDAHPWATVESVVDQASSRAVSLPNDHSTPLRLTLPAGTYRVTMKHPEVAAPVVLIAQVEAKKTREQSTRFQTLRADDYLRRAGFSP